MFESSANKSWTEAAAPSETVDAPAPPRERSSLEQRAVDALYRTLSPALCVLIQRKYRRSAADAEDAVQSAFAQLLAQPDFGSMGNPKGFLYRAACNLVVSNCRHECVKGRYAGELRLLGEASAATIDPARLAEVRDDLRVVSGIVEGLEPRQRQVLALRSLEEYSHVEISRELKISQTRSKQLYAQALKACSNALSDEEC